MNEQHSLCHFYRALPFPVFPQYVYFLLLPPVSISKMDEKSLLAEAYKTIGRRSAQQTTSLLLQHDTLTSSVQWMLNNCEAMAPSGTDDLISLAALMANRRSCSGKGGWQRLGRPPLKCGLQNNRTLAINLLAKPPV